MIDVPWYSNFTNMLVSEKLLHFIWKHQYYQKTPLYTDEGDSLMILNPGTYNHNQGPDFTDAIIRINDIKFVGNIEIHINSSDWKAHQHQADPNYNNVILHIIWNNNGSVENNNGQLIPQLTICNLVPKWLLNRYDLLMNTSETLPCSTFLPSIKPIIWDNWKERLTVERLEEKTNRIMILYEESNHHWEEVLWWLMAHNFGLKLNDELFFQMAKSIPVKILAKHRSQLYQIEALLFGQANLFNGNCTEEYHQVLSKEHQFLLKIYELKSVPIQPVFLRMRPSGFPTIRIAQLATLIQHSTHLFSLIKETEDVQNIRKLFQVNTSEYWNKHYVFGKESITREKTIGNTMIENIIINTIIPILFTYGKLHKDEALMQRMINWLSQLLPESNAILTKWEKNAIANQNAFDSQGLLQLSTHYCKTKRCMECAIGNSIMTSAKNN